MKSYFISATSLVFNYIVFNKYYSKYKTANTFTETSKQSKNRLSDFTPWSVPSQGKGLRIHLVGFCVCDGMVALQ